MTTLRFKMSVKAAPTVAVPAAVYPAARSLALAHFIQREIGAGRWTSYRQAARALGMSHARVQHVVALLALPVAVQTEVLLGRVVCGDTVPAAPITSGPTTAGASGTNAGHGRR